MLTNELMNRFQIFSRYNHRSLEEFEAVLKLSRKQILNDVEKLNAFFKDNNIPLIQLDHETVHFPEVPLNDLLKALHGQLQGFYFQEERPDMIVLYLLLSDTYISNYHLQDMLRVSKNTVLADIKALRVHLSATGIDLVYSRQAGYTLVGPPPVLRTLLAATVSKIFTFQLGKLLVKYILDLLDKQVDFEVLFHQANAISKDLRIQMIPEKFRDVIYTAVLSAQNQQFYDEVIPVPHFQAILSTLPFKFAQGMVEVFPWLDRVKLYLCAGISGCIQGDLAYDQRQGHGLLVTVMEQIITQVKRHTGVEFEDNLDFRKNLYAHLVPAYYRLLFRAQLINPMKGQIMEEYRSLFFLIKKSLVPLEAAVGTTISDDEIAYFTIHFGGYLHLKEHKANRTLRALSVCPSGISSSLILQAELKKIFPQMRFSNVHHQDKLSQLNQQSFDLVFSTVHIETDKPLYVVKPMMNAVEKAILKKKISEDFGMVGSTHLSVEEVLKVIEKHTQIQNRNGLIADLSTLLFEEVQASKEELGLNDLLTDHLIQQVDKVDNWQEAIRLAAQPLLQQDYIEEGYIDAMINSVKKSGAYIVLAPRVAVPHATPESGVRKLGMSLLQLKVPVDFNLEGEADEDKLVSLIFVLAAADATSHLKSLQQLAQVLDDEAALDALIEAPSAAAIIHILEATIKEEEE